MGGVTVNLENSDEPTLIRCKTVDIFVSLDGTVSVRSKLWKIPLVNVDANQYEVVITGPEQK